jgi:hypothetical protein
MRQASIGRRAFSSTGPERPRAAVSLGDRSKPASGSGAARRHRRAAPSLPASPKRAAGCTSANHQKLGSFVKKRPRAPSPRFTAR